MDSSQSLLSRRNTLVQGRQSAHRRSTRRTSWPSRCLTAMYCIVLSVFQMPVIVFKSSSPVGFIKAIFALSFAFPFVCDSACLGCSRYLIQSNPQSIGDNRVISTHHPLRRSLCRFLERAHISRSWSATTLHCLSIRSVCLHLWWRGTNCLHYGPHARIRCGKREIETSMNVNDYGIYSAKRWDMHRNSYFCTFQPQRTHHKAFLWWTLPLDHSLCLGILLTLSQENLPTCSTFMDQQVNDAL